MSRCCKSPQNCRPLSRSSTTWIRRSMGSCSEAQALTLMRVLKGHCFQHIQNNYFVALLSPANTLPCSQKTQLSGRLEQHLESPTLMALRRELDDLSAGAIRKATVQPGRGGPMPTEGDLVRLAHDLTDTSLLDSACTPCKYKDIWHAYRLQSTCYPLPSSCAASVWHVTAGACNGQPYFRPRPLGCMQWQT